MIHWAINLQSQHENSMPYAKSMLTMLWHGRETLQALRGMRNQHILSADEHLKLCGDWLLTARRCSRDGGYAACFSLLNGWSKGYVETTGYIIPTLLEISSALREPRYRADAVSSADWLLSTQRPDGAFPDLDGNAAAVFDTGQVLLGLERLFRETGEERFRDATLRAADWLLSVQQPNGAWLTDSGAEKTYQTRTAAALMILGAATKRTQFTSAGENALHWAAAQQAQNGFFAKCELRAGEAFLLHTMMYVLEGFLMAWKATGRREYLEIAIKAAEPLKRINRTRDLVLYSYYREDWTAASTEKCVPGLAQWAGVCLQLYDATADPEYLHYGSVALYYVQSKQIQSGSVLKGALPASVPFWGRYQPYAFVNWGVKFFADALLQFRGYGIPVWKQQEEFVSQCFRLRADSGRWAKHSTTLDVLDERIMRRIANLIRSHCTAPPNDQVDVLDLGCGEGRCIEWLRTTLPDVRCCGVDPVPPVDNDSIRAGSAYEIPFPDESFDVVYSYLTLQHVSDLSRVFGEVQRVLKPGGMVVVADRHRVSARGFFKPWHEFKGRWMYSWDSSFRERWYTPGEWRSLFENEGFEVLSKDTLCNPKDRGIRRLLATNRFLIVAGRKLPTNRTSTAATSTPLPPSSAELSSVAVSSGELQAVSNGTEVNHGGSDEHELRK